MRSEKHRLINATQADIFLYGLFFYKDFSEGEESLLAFYDDFCSGMPCFDDCTGSYRVEIQEKSGQTIYFSDNSGMMHYYIHETTATFTTSLAEAMPKMMRTPNYSGIAQFLYYGYTFGTETTIADVFRSDPDLYYLVEKGILRKKSKNLTDMEALHSPENALELQMRRFVHGLTANERLACTITGGTDSRTVLSHLLHNGLHPILTITGHDSQPDVQIAKTIAKELNAELLYCSDAPEGENWIDEAIEASDGMTGTCGTYRLYKKARALRTAGITVECGGVAGEMYKNSFINQDYPFYVGTARWSHFQKYKVDTYAFPESICGENIMTFMKELPRFTAEFLSAHKGNNKANAYLAAGYHILQYRIAGLSCMNSHHYIPYNPLIERNVAALAFQKNPYKLEMQSYQREQVSNFCPQLKDIPTDRCLTCNADRKVQEQLKSMAFLIKVAMERVFRRNLVNGRIDPCFEAAIASPQYYSAIERCKLLGILSPDASNLPLTIADRVLTLGSFL